MIDAQNWSMRDESERAIAEGLTLEEYQRRAQQRKLAESIALPETAKLAKAQEALAKAKAEAELAEAAQLQVAEDWRKLSVQYTDAKKDLSNGVYTGEQAGYLANDCKATIETIFNGRHHLPQYNTPRGAMAIASDLLAAERVVAMFADWKAQAQARLDKAKAELLAFAKSHKITSDKLPEELRVGNN